MRDELIELLKQSEKAYAKLVHETSFMPDKAKFTADYLIDHGVTIIPAKPERPPTDLRCKCGGCEYAVPVQACGSTYAYVKCTHPEHLGRYRKARHHAGIRQRTTKACKKYRQREGL